MTKVLFLISTLSSGGAARVLSVLANHFSERSEFDVSILTHVRATGYVLGKQVQRAVIFEPIEMQASLWSKVWRRLVYWPRFFSAITRSRPDVVVVFLRGMNWRGILACRVLGIRVIVTEHTNHQAERGFWSWIERRLFYRFADRLVVLSDFDRTHYSRYLDRVSLIPNPLSVEPLSDKVARSPVVLGVGDMNRWHIKGFDTLIDVFSRLSADFPDWNLRLVGPGEDGLRVLRERVSAAGMGGRIEFCGFTRAIERHMQGCEVFALTSRHEGFSMVLLEAMSQGCACVAFDCKAGPRDLIASDRNGLLVPDQDVERMEHALRLLMDSQATRQRLADAAVLSSRAYEMANIELNWVNILKGKGIA